MFAAERLKLIKNILIEKKQINVMTLSNMLSVSEVTIRRDLEKLENEEFLTRTHGGAIINEPKNEIQESVFVPQDDTYIDEKQRIAKIASSMIHDGSTLILGPGNTCYYIAKEIKTKQQLTVVTTDILTAVELLSEKNNQHRVILCGGFVDARTLSLTGNMAEDALNNIFVELAFVEVDGVSFQHGYSVNSLDKSSIIRKILSTSSETIALAPYQHFLKRSFSPLGKIDLFKKIISNEQVPDEFKKYYYDNNMQLLTTFDVYKE